jgi:GalNAc-alpha-(1->4)-GalNAc-alpha-(1->3)-diNAcBac-PP-undecaprenol alpha-1,4-N-acetyl-D-galactosaminyltransferase
MNRSVADDAAKPKVVLLIAAMDCGGAQRVMADMANHWVRSGWRVTLATWSGPEIEDFYPLSSALTRVWLDGPISGRSVVAQIRSTARRIFKLRSLLIRTRPDVLLSFIDVSNIHAVLAASGLDVRVVVSERTDPAMNHTISRPWRILRRLCYWRADVIVAQTDGAARWLENQCKVNVQVIPNSLRVMPTPTVPRERLIIAVGRLKREKGFDVLLDAFASLKSRFPDWTVRILGEGPERSALQQQARALRIDDRVEFAGAVDNVEAWMSRAALLVHPSRREGFPNAVLEAMAMGMAVVCANCRSGPSELIEDGVNGRLVAVDDGVQLATAMDQLMSDGALRERFGANASAVRERYSASKVMDMWERCLLRGTVLGSSLGPSRCRAELEDRRSL